MKLYFFQGDVPNFGDELSPWLMSKVFPGLLDEDNSELLLAIGSIIFDHIPAIPSKIVFGSGYGGYTNLPDLSQNWNFYCVRGPRTAVACGLPLDKVAGDAAILIRRHRLTKSTSGRRLSFMPHWQSIDRGHWAEACKIANIQYIAPSAPVEQVLDQIEDSAVLITEAMHGAIVADALRVPWIPVMPIHRWHRMKWYDWAEALDIKLNPQTLWPSSAREVAALRNGEGEGTIFQRARGLLKTGVEILDWGLIRLAAKRLSDIAKTPPMLSSDTALERVLDKLETSAADIRRTHLN